MAKFTFGVALGDEWLPDLYGNLKLVSKSATKLVYEDADGTSIVATGSGLKASKAGVTAGTVTGLQFLQDGDALLTVSKASFKAKALFDAYSDNDNLYDLFSFLTAGKDNIVGTGIGEQILPGTNAGNDTITAGGGEDYVAGSAGNNRIDGGSDFDTLSYQDAYYDSNAKTGIVLDVAKGTVKNSWGGTDKIKNFESYRGSHLADKLTGSGASEHLSGLGGRDVIDGGGGFDTVRYERDTRFGGNKGIVADLAKGTVKDGFGLIDTIKNIEAVRGTKFADVFKGDGNDNLFRGLAGKDSFDGGAGSDIVQFLTGDDPNAHGINVDMTLSTNQIRDDGYGNVETMRSIEKVQGGEQNDTIRLGSADVNALGGEGDDTIIAGNGESQVGGDEGADTFVFETVASSAAFTETRDFIQDFSQTEGDKIDLSAFAGLTFVGEGDHVVGQNTITMFFSDTGNTVVGADTNGDGVSDLQVVLGGHIDLRASDFILA